MPVIQTDAFTRMSVFYRPRAGTSCTEKPLTVAASQTIQPGDLVAYSSGANTIEQAIALPGSNSTGTASGGNLPVLGVALEGIVTNASGFETNTNRTQIRVGIFDGNLEVLMRVYNATASASEFRDIQLGTPYQFQRWRSTSASIWWYSATTTTTNGEIVPVELYIGSAADDDYAPVWWRLVTTEAVQQG